MPTKAIGKEYEVRLGPDGRGVLVKNEKTANAKLSIPARLARESGKKLRYGKKAKGAV